jgi:hypothetical protein
METWYTVSNDTAATITATLTEADGTAINLTGASVKLLYVESSVGGTATSVACSVSDAAAGIVTVSPTFEDPGRYLAEFQITFSDDSIRTVPTADTVRLLVRGELGS